MDGSGFNDVRFTPMKTSSTTLAFSCSEADAHLCIQHVLNLIAAPLRMCYSKVFDTPKNIRGTLIPAHITIVPPHGIDVSFAAKRSARRPNDR